MDMDERVTILVPEEIQTDLRISIIKAIGDQAAIVTKWADSQMPLTDWSDAPTPLPGSRMWFPSLSDACVCLAGLHDFMSHLGICGEVDGLFIEGPKRSAKLAAEQSILDLQQVKEECGDLNANPYHDRVIRFWGSVLEQLDDADGHIDVPSYYREMAAA